MDVIKDSTDISTYFTLRDSTNHAPKTDVTITDIDLYYVPYKGAMAAKADATALAAADSAHADNKAFHVGQGLYRIDWPDIWTGAVGTQVQLIVVCTGVDTTFLEVNIVSPAQTGDSYAKVSGLTFTVAGDVDVNVQSWKGSAAPDISDDATIAAAVRDVAIAGAAADSVGAAVAAVKSDTGAILTDTGTTLDGKIDTIDGIVDSILADTGTDGVVVAAGSKTGYSIGVGGIAASAFAANALDAAALAADAGTEIANAIKAIVVEAQGSYTLQQALSIILSVLAGVTADNGATLKTPNGAANRVAATIDANANRTAMTLTPSA